MNLIYYKSEIGNFGDDLNPWLWEKLLGDFSKYDENVDFVGIGSIYDKRLEDGRKKIIFGTGVRDFLYAPNDKDKFENIFVRGPISAKAIGDCKYITDSAYCIALLDSINTLSAKKKYKLSFMPYFSQVFNFNWKLFEKLSGIKVILPTQSVDEILEDIACSEKLISAAMHGCIIADILRVPWIRCRIGIHEGETLLTSETKWADWLLSMNLNCGAITLPFNIDSSRALHSKNIIMEKQIKLIYRFLRNEEYFLSTDNLFDEKLELLNQEIYKLNNIKSFS